MVHCRRWQAARKAPFADETAPFAERRAARSRTPTVGIPATDKPAAPDRIDWQESMLTERAQMTARSKDIPMLTLRAQITIEVSALDYVEAAQHQRRVEALLEIVRAQYAGAAFTFHHLRPRPADEARAEQASPPRRYKTRPRVLAVYHDS
jgi:hypothetical protein